MSPKLATIYAILFYVNIILGADHQELIATFTSENSGAVGTVIVTEGTVAVDLDISGINTTSLPVEECFDEGMKYHIHVYWTWADESNFNDQIGATNCGAGYTGGHYDPWQGCGSATANPYCTTKSNYGCIDINDYACDFAADPYSCEIGDWSSKYGALIPDDDGIVSRTDSSFFEVDIYDIAGMSVVFHCSTAAGGARAMCAPFLHGETSDDESPTQTDSDDVIAKFGDLGSIKMFASGAVEIELNADNADEIDLDDFSCTDFEYTVWNDWDPVDPDYSFDSDDCKTYIGAQYDPTRQCLPWSEDTEFCQNGQLCYDMMNATDYEYDYSCNRYVDRFSCAPGDLSGKFGAYPADQGEFTYEDDDSDTLIPQLSLLINSPSSIVIHCPYNEEADDIEILACAKIETNSSNYFNIFISVFVTIVFAIVH